MKLKSENIIPSHRRSEFLPIITTQQDIVWVFRNHIITMNKIESALLVYTAKYRMLQLRGHLIPAHMWNLSVVTPFETDAIHIDPSKPRFRSLLRSQPQHLTPETHPHDRLSFDHDLLCQYIHQPTLA